MSLKFSKPPLEEVLISVYFPPIKGLQTQHAGYFWSKIKKEYPTCDSLDPVGEAVQFDDEPVPFPRYKFTSGDDTEVVQIQKNGFMINWRARNPSVSYPHYDAIRSKFVEYFSRFKEFISSETGESIQSIDAINLGYMNFFKSDRGNIFENACVMLHGLESLGSSCDLGSIAGFSQTYVVEVSANQSVRVNIMSSQRTSDEAEGTRFEVRALGIPESADTKPLVEWLDSSHATLEQFFVKLTTPEAHNLWGSVATDGGIRG